MEPIIAWIGQALASSVLTILAYLGIKSTAVGERFLNHHLERKIADLKHLHDESIEALRADLAHLQDRGRRANELEFDAAAKIWHAFVDAHMKTQQAIADYMSFPDLNRLSDEDLAAFLETSELSDQQRKQVVGASDKVRMYSKIMRLRKINTSGAAIYEGRLLLQTSGIFISSTMARSFKDGFDVLSKAQVEQYIDFQHGSARQESSMSLIGGGGEKLLSLLESLVRAAIRRD